MMRKALIVLSVVAVIVALLPTQSRAADGPEIVFGGFGWLIPPFIDRFCLTFENMGTGNQFKMTGINGVTREAVVGSAVLVNAGATILLMGWSAQASTATSAFTFEGTLSNFTGNGTGRCQVINPAVGGCGTGTVIAYVFLGGCNPADTVVSETVGPRAGGGD